MALKKSKEVVKHMKLEFFSNKATQDPQKPFPNSGESVENCTILGNLYYLKSYYTGDLTK